MPKRHSVNTNLTIISSGHYQGFSVYHKPISRQYLDAIIRTIQASLNEYPRTLLIRFDLHLPTLNFEDSPMLYDTTVIGKFFKSLNAKIQHDRYIKGSQGKRVHSCKMRYVWAKERANAVNDHYHVAIFLNNDAYNHLSKYKRNGQNLSSKIVEAWASALGIDVYGIQNLIHFPRDTPMYYINRNAENYIQTLESALYRLSYLAKLETKHFGDRTRSFGCSHN